MNLNGFISPSIFANKRGIPRFASDSISVSTTSVDYVFNGFPKNSDSFCGLILFKLSQEIPTGTTDTLPIIFNLGGETKNLTYLDGENVTVANMSGQGIYLAILDCTSNTLQLLTGYTA